MLEVLFIHLRSDPNIRGIKIVRNEVKLTSYADDASYFMRDKISAENLLAIIGKFSKVSGLEINRTKSECLLLDFEMNLGTQEDNLCGIPLVENLKILGHFFGKNKNICDFQIFYSKIIKFEKIENIWKQRALTIMGKNLLINSLLNSLFIFNAQIELPPKDFIKIIEAKNKNFLWGGGVAKIAHHSLVGDYHEGGIKYKDLNAFVLSVNFKFLVRLKYNTTVNNTCLPRVWLMQLFQIPTEYDNNDDQEYFHEFFSKQLHILDCKLKIPRRALWKGHPYYFDVLQSYVKCSEDCPRSLESILSMPLWYNKFLDTKFNIKLSQLGFNYLRDIYIEGKVLTRGEIILNWPPVISRPLLSLTLKIPAVIKNAISRNKQQPIVIFPSQTILYKGADYRVSSMESSAVYSKLIEPKVKMPTGLLNWCMDFELSDSQIRTALTFAHQSCTNIFDRVFQYKIVTQILPTNEYLTRYRVRESNLCDHCELECDSIVHRLYDCETLNPIIDSIFSFLKSECNQSYSITMIEYMFGKQGEKYLALNHILLELKKTIFYSSTVDLNSPSFCEQFYNKIRSLIIKEKRIFCEKNKFENFCERWGNFLTIYDFRGPDVDSV